MAFVKLMVLETEYVVVALAIPDLVDLLDVEDRLNSLLETCASEVYENISVTVVASVGW